MKHITRGLSGILIASTLAGCTFYYHDRPRLCADSKGNFMQCNDMVILDGQQSQDATLFKTSLHFQLLSEYTEQMVSDLAKDLEGQTLKKPVAVTSFVYLDSNMQETNTLGQQLAEFFINDLQAIGVSVSDKKVTDDLVIRPNGDFVLSKRTKAYDSDNNIGYVLVGTMVRNPRGVVLNVRIVNFDSKRVIASSSKLLPNQALSG